MPNTIFSSEGALLFIMVAIVALGFWLQRFKAFKTLGPALTAKFKPHFCISCTGLLEIRPAQND